MKKRGKNYLAMAEKKVKQGYDLFEAVEFFKENSQRKFDETLELHFNLGVDPKHSEQVVRGNVLLPHGTGKKVTVLVFAKGPAIEQAKSAGADFIVDDEIIRKILEDGWMEFDKVVSTPDMMPVVGKLARILGPRGLMPNPKTRTVTPNIEKAVQELKAGKVSYRVDKTSNVHITVGKMSFNSQALVENGKALIESVVKGKPATAKGEYVKSISLTTTMSPSISLSKNLVR